MDFKPFSSMWLCMLLVFYVTNQKVVSQSKKNDVWNLNLNELLIIVWTVFSIVKMLFCSISSIQNE